MLEPPIRLIADADALGECREALSGARALGMDTEFVRERTYYPRPGLVQFSDGRQVWLVDPVALDGSDGLRTFLAGLMRSPEVTKILHSTGEDLEVIDRVAGEAAPPSPLFDTQRAAALLGWPLQVRYEVLAQDLLGIEFPGGLGRNNWLKRPLPEAWIDYAAHDVIALNAMRDRLAERLARAGRLDWLAEDCERIAARPAAAREDEAVVRIRGAAGLDDEELERLVRLARWREAEARRRDRPRGFVVRDETLLELARAGADRADRALADARGLSRTDRERVQALLAEPPGDFSRPPELVPLDRPRRERLKSLQRRVRETAESVGVEAPLLASKRDLTRLIQGVRCDWLEGWRGELLDLD